MIWSMLKISERNVKNMNKYAVSYRAEIREDLSDELVLAGEILNANIFDPDEALIICADGFFECYIDACDKLVDMFERKADITITGIILVKRE